MRTTVKKVEGRGEVMVSLGQQVEWQDGSRTWRGLVGGTYEEPRGVGLFITSGPHSLGQAWNGVVNCEGATLSPSPLSAIIGFSPKSIRIFDTTGSQVGPTYPDMGSLKAQPASESVDRELLLKSGNIVVIPGKGPARIFSTIASCGNALLDMDSPHCHETNSAGSSFRLWDHIGWRGESVYRTAIIYDNLAEYLQAKIDEATKAADWRSQFRVERWKGGWAVLNEDHWLEKDHWLKPTKLERFEPVFHTESEAREALRLAPKPSVGPAALRSAA